MPPAPALSRVIFDDGNPQRTAITSATLVFTQPVSLGAGAVNLVKKLGTTSVALTLSNPTGDGKTWITSWKAAAFNNALPDGSYSLTVHGAAIVDSHGQTAGGDTTASFTSADGPVVTSVAFSNAAAPHSLAVTFSENVSASVSLNTLKVVNSSAQAISAAHYSWNAATLTATWTFAGALKDDAYTATISAAAAKNADGVRLDGNSDGIPGDDYSYAFTQVKPSVVVSGLASVMAHQPYTLGLGAITDAGQASPRYLVHWGDGNSGTFSNAGNITHAYGSAIGPTNIVVDILDANGVHAACATVAVSISHMTLPLGGNSNANPGAAYSLNLGTALDPGHSVSRYIVHWGDGATNTYTTGGIVKHVYANNQLLPVKAAITVDVIDNSGAGGANFTSARAATLPLTINLRPTLALTGNYNATVSGIYRLALGTPIDLGFIPSGYIINWGDGSKPMTVAAGTMVVSHIFAKPTGVGANVMTITLLDNSGVYANAGRLAITVH